MKLPSILTPDGRRAWSFAAIVGGCVVFTAFAAVGVYLVRNSPWFAFCLALAAHAQILVGMTALSFVLGRRVKIEATRNGLSVDDREESE